LILDPLAVLSHLERRDLSDDEARELIWGRAVEVSAPDGGPLRLVVGERLLGVGSVENGKLVSETILAGSLEELAAR
jgi:hypothetical protein